MAINLANSFTGAAESVAWNKGMSPDRQAERSAAYADKEQRDQALRNLKATEPTERDRATMAEAQSVELQNALETQKAMLRDNNKRTSFDAFERYDADGDVRHINTMLNDLNKSGSKLYGLVARVDKVTENDRQALENMNLAPALIEEILRNPELNKSYVKVTKKDGTTMVGNVDSMKGLTGYNDYANEKELARQKNAREVEMLAFMGYNLDPLGREAFRRTKAELGFNVDPMSSEFQNHYSEVYDKLQRDKLRGRNSATAIADRGENKTEREAEADRRARLEGYEPGTLEYDRAFSSHMSAINSEFQRPSATRNLEVGEAARAELETAGFWELDINNLTPQQRGTWEGKIRRIEQLTGADISAEDRKELARIQKLISLGSAAGELTDEQTGIIDRVLGTAKRYIFDNVEGTEATAAYSAYRNIVLHALYGATLAPSEERRFVEQFGSLSQQRGPVLKQLRTTMQEIADTYQAIVRINDPMVIAWRTGKTEEELNDVIDALNERIEYIDKISKGEVVPYTTINPPIDSNQEVAPRIDPKNRQIMDKLSGKSGDTQ